MYKNNEITVSEKVLMAIQVATLPTKTNYRYLERFQPDGMVVIAEFSDGSASAITEYNYPITPLTTLGEQVINLDYTYDDVTKSTTLVVMVSAIETAVPTQINIPIYDGTIKTPVWIGFDSVKMKVSGETSGVNACNYTVKFRLTYGYLFPNGTDKATVSWSIQKAVISTLPIQINVLYADGMPKTPIWDNRNASQLVIGGDKFGIEVGNYTATFTPTANYQWWDKTTEEKSVIWIINQDESRPSDISKDYDSIVIDQAYRLTMLELGLIGADI